MREYCEATVAFVFMYPGWPYDPTTIIETTLASVCVQDADGTCCV